MLRREDVHAVHVRDTGGDPHRFPLWFRSVQEWLPQAQGHR